MVHSFLVDMLLFCQREKGQHTEESLDISHVMWSELLSAISERKCPIYGPFIMLLIETGELVSHEVKRLRKKDNWGTQVPRSRATSSAAAMETEEEADATADDDYEPSGSEPSWAKKLKIKVKKLFCMESHGQYMTHVAEKKARGRHKELMRQVGAILISGSEDQLTEEEEWIQQHCPWTDSDAEHFQTDDGGADDPAEI